MRATTPGGHLTPGAFGRVQGAPVPPPACPTCPPTNKKTAVIPTCLPVDKKVPTGMVLMDLDGLDDFVKNVVEKHARSCPAGTLDVVKQTRFGWDLDRTYRCSFCKKEFTFSTGPKNDAGAKKTRGRQMRPINKIMSSSILKSGCVRAQAQEMFEESGIICPSKCLFLIYIIFRCCSICFRATAGEKSQRPIRMIMDFILSISGASHTEGLLMILPRTASTVTMASARSLARFSSSRASSLGVERARSIAGRCVVNALTEGETAGRRQWRCRGRALPPNYLTLRGVGSLLRRRSVGRAAAGDGSVDGEGGDGSFSRDAENRASRNHSGAVDVAAVEAEGRSMGKRMPPSSCRMANGNGGGGGGGWRL